MIFFRLLREKSEPQIYRSGEDAITARSPCLRNLSLGHEFYSSFTVFHQL